MDSFQSSKPAIIFDLGGVVFDTDTRTIVRRACALFHESISTYEVKNFFIELAQIKSIQPHEITGRNEDGYQYPPVLNDFLVGVPSKQILENIAQQKGTNSRFWQLARMVFNPEVLAQLYVIIPQGERFVRECARAGYPLYILSNWDIDSFPLVRKKYEQLFNLFSGIVISAECKLIKPDPAIYTLLLRKYRLKPNHCFVVDNQRENIEVAQSMGMHGVLCQGGTCGPNFDRVKSLLAEELALLR
jgi:HAD superfamily hydrolase (TIGR01549 family)